MRRIYFPLVLASVLGLPAVRAEDAKVNFEAKCAMCHGKEGKGDTKAGQKLGIRDYTDPKVQATLKDDEILKAIKEGVKKEDKVLMKGFSDKLTDDEIKALAAYMRAFKK
jgi:cytochrome c553